MHDSGTGSLRTLAPVLGHADASFTLRTYAHSSDEATRTATAVLATLFEMRVLGSRCWRRATCQDNSDTTRNRG